MDMQRSDGQARSKAKSPTRPSPKPPGLTSVLERNIQSLSDRRKREEEQATVQERLAETITRFTGSMLFVFIHLALFGSWIIINLGWTPLPRFDESFVVLAMIASVEAIFLSTFVLISQNRMQAQADKRADLDLQVSLLAEHEITETLRLVRELAARSGVEEAHDPGLDELEQDVRPETVLSHIEAAEQHVARQRS